MSINYPYEVFVGSDIVEFSFTLPNSFVSIFTEDDRLPTIPEDEQDDDHFPEYRYEATVKVVRDRLEIMGYTSARWREELEIFRQLKLEETEELIAEAEDNGQPTLRASRTGLVFERSAPAHSASLPEVMTTPLTAASSEVCLMIASSSVIEVSSSTFIERPGVSHVTSTMPSASVSVLKFLKAMLVAPKSNGAAVRIAAAAAV